MNYHTALTRSIQFVCTPWFVIGPTTSKNKHTCLNRTWESIPFIICLNMSPKYIPVLQTINILYCKMPCCTTKTDNHGCELSLESLNSCVLYIFRNYLLSTYIFHLQDNWPSEFNSNTLSTITRRLGIHVGVPNSSSIRWFKSTTHLWRQQRNHEGTDCPNHCLRQVNQTNLKLNKKLYEM